MNRKERNSIADGLEDCWYYKPKDETDKRQIQLLFESCIKELRK